MAGLATRLPDMSIGLSTPANVAKQRRQRKQRFQAALALTGMTQAGFADKHDIDPGHLSKVLSGERVSGKLVSKIDAFIAKYLPAQQNEGAA